MANITDQHGLGVALQEIRGNWGGFVALGVVLMIAGGIVSANLFVATLPSFLYVGAMMFAGGVLELVDAFTVAGRQRKNVRFLAGGVYSLAGAIVVFDPLLASVTLSLVLGILLSCVGALRIGFGSQHHDERSRGWIVAAGAFTLIAGTVVLIAWPGISLWLLGAIFTVDVIFQGWSFTSLGLAIRARR
jgi:uncharacterized membrane protein HdeD (DUF308 family)